MVPHAAEVMKRCPRAHPRRLRPASPPPAAARRPSQSTWGPAGQELAAAATPRPTRVSEAVATTLSITGATTEVVHSGGGCTSGSGPLVKIKEHPGLATRTSVARRN